MAFGQNAPSRTGLDISRMDFMLNFNQLHQESFWFQLKKKTKEVHSLKNSKINIVIIVGCISINYEQKVNLAFS